MYRYKMVGDRDSRIGVGHGVRLELMALGILISLVVPSLASVCDTAVKGHRLPEEYEDGTIPFILEKGDHQITLPICRIKNNNNCLGLTEDETKSTAELKVMDEIIEEGLASIGNAQTLPKLPSASLTEMQREFRDLFIDFSRWYCVSGNCQPVSSNSPNTAKCVPSTNGKPNTDVWIYDEHLEKLEALNKKWDSTTTTTKRSTKSVGSTGQSALRLTVLAITGLSLAIFNHLHPFGISN